jgi:hypothetical protein
MSPFFKSDCGITILCVFPNAKKDEGLHSITGRIRHSRANDIRPPFEYIRLGLLAKTIGIGKTLQGPQKF